MKKLICLALALVMVLLSFGMMSCDGNDGPDINTDGDVPTFGGATIRVSVSDSQNPQTTFSSAKKFTQGVDGATQDAVLKAVQVRNNSVAQMLDIKVEYERTELTYDKVLEDVKTKRLNASDKTRIDVYHNDIYGLTRAMLAGYLANVADTSVQTFFKFDDGNWNTAYMNGSTFDTSKIYLLAGDYHLDMIRYAYVIFTNVTQFNAAYSKNAAYRNYKSYAELVEQIVGTGEWYYDDMMYLAREGHIDSKNSGITDEDDARIGLCLNNLSPRIFVYGSGLSMMKQVDGKPMILTDADLTDFATLSGKYTTLFNAPGVLYINDVLASTANFMNGTYIMSMAQLGEMESTDMRNTDFQRGILPFPAYNDSQTLHTVIHDQAEITAILGNTKSFAMSSAYMQYLNAESSAIHTAYYEDQLGFKYNTDVDNAKYVRDMIDVVWEHIDSPYDSLLASYICGVAQPSMHVFQIVQDDAQNKTTNFRSVFGEYQPAYQTALETVLDTYKTILK